MFRKSNVNKTVNFFLVSIKYRDIITVKTVTKFYFITKIYKEFFFIFLLKALKTRKRRKKAYTNFILLGHSINIVRQFKKASLHKSIKILHFLTLARIQKCLT